MSKVHKKLNRVLVTVGVLLIAASILTVVITPMVQNSNAKKAAEIANNLYALMPPVRNSVPSDRSNVAMPMIELEGSNFIGVIDIPAYGASLPICEVWDRFGIANFPCRYLGSVYDGSLIIGGSGSKGQFDFLKLISDGEAVYVTDTTGARYAYVVTAIEKTNDVSTEHLTAKEADLVLFARNNYALDYTVVRCKLKNK